MGADDLCVGQVVTDTMVQERRRTTISCRPPVSPGRDRHQHVAQLPPLGGEDVLVAKRLLRVWDLLQHAARDEPFEPLGDTVSDSQATKRRTMTLPPIVSPAEWQVARDELMVKEKQATRALDALAAERRRLPVVEVRGDYVFQGPGGQVTLLELFEGRPQLIVYHFMLGPGEEPCVGCSSFIDNFGYLTHLHARGTSLALVSRAPYDEIAAVKRRMEWTVPWYSSFGTDFNLDFRVTVDDRETFGLSVFLRDGGRIYRSYFTASRGVDRLRLDFNLLDLTPLGRQEEWEDSPPGWPQTPAYTWWRLRDRYDDRDVSAA
jgi:predicted dithiol-disulfide oxidoreductase (DUF899 family)